ncbi:MAG: LysM peptidoglycan-binding domain-containing protein, partial [Sulfurovaceae bacterium]|nr:LysM peptidoglycan-binding domain-containing protein [Sulfurovaceae bacterium]
QDEYNDYYAQETRGAEISSKENNGGGKKIAFIILLLLLIIALAYFGWRSMNSSDKLPTKIDKTDIPSKDISTEENKTLINKKPIVESVKKEPIPQKEPTTTIQTENISKEVQNIASTDGNAKMDPEDIANIVQMVMQKMNKDKSKESTKSNSETKSVENRDDQLQDSKLIRSLSDSEVDSLSTVSNNTDAITDKSKKASSSDKPNTYNKVILDEKLGKSSDELSKLSDEISSAINTEESETKDNTNYTKSITKEVKIRTKEMRYITVKKGDTLGKIAHKVYGNVMDYKKIYEANPNILRRADKIYIGQRLRVPE